MIDFPEGEQRRVFKQFFIHGAIFWLEKYFFDDDTTKSKYILVLNPCDEQENSHFYLTTSKVSKILSNPILKDKCYILPAEEVNCFPKETAINVTQIVTKSYLAMEEKYVSHTYGDTLKFIQKLPDNVMADIQQMIIGSPYLSPQQKLKIYPRAWSKS